ncbi:hypothetical protein NL676_019646 [Syzygium grande]|nr:hypothetical protein NL676_019646 [Syzygium grande]
MELKNEVGQGGIGTLTVPSSISSTFLIERRSDGPPRMHQGPAFTILSSCLLSINPSCPSFSSSPAKNGFFIGTVPIHTPLAADLQKQDCRAGNVGFPCHW